MRSEPGDPHGQHPPPVRGNQRPPPDRPAEVLDLRHTGNTLAAQGGSSLADLKARMGHDSVRAAMIYQHAVAEADQKIANSLDQRLGEAHDDARDQS